MSRLRVHAVTMNTIAAGADWPARVAEVGRLIVHAPLAEARAAAEALYAQALEAARMDVAADLAVRVGTDLNESVEIHSSVAWLERALGLYARLGDNAGEVLVSSLLAARLGRLDCARAVGHLSRCIERIGDAELSTAQRTLVNRALAHVYHCWGLTEAALRITRQQLEISKQTQPAESAPLWQARVNVLNMLRYRIDETRPVDPATSARALAEALALVEEVMPYRHKAPDHLQVYGFAMCGMVLARAGRSDEACVLLRQALAHPTARRSDFAKTSRGELALLLLAAGHADEARAACTQARTELWRGCAQTADLELWELQALARLAPVHGDWREAHDCQESIAARIRIYTQALLDAKVSSLGCSLSEESLRLHFDDLRVANRDLSRQATIDGLTEVLNRRALESEYLRRLDAGIPMAVLMVDVDHFKAVNDVFSHAVGDAVLRQIARLLADTARDVDCVARYGGEELPLLLALDAAPAVAPIAERMRACVEAHDWPSIAPGLAVTISGGWTLARALEPFGTAVARADAHLYDAKRAGRNRVIGA